MKDQHGQQHRGQRLQIAAYRDGLRGKTADRGKVTIAADARVHQAKQQDGRPVACGDLHGKLLPAVDKERYDDSGTEKLYRCVFCPADLLCQHHDGVGDCRQPGVPQDRACVPEQKDDLPGSPAVYRISAVPRNLVTGEFRIKRSLNCHFHLL